MRIAKAFFCCSASNLILSSGILALMRANCGSAISTMNCSLYLLDNPAFKLSTALIKEGIVCSAKVLD